MNTPALVPPPGYAATRDALHRLARYVITPRRQTVDGRERLIQLPGGFGTPVLGDDTQMRVEGTDLVVVRRGEVTRESLTTLRRAAEMVGIAPSDHTAKPDIPPLGDIDEPLAVDPIAAAYLARWFELGWAALAAVGADDASTGATEIVLWSHHFDPSIEIGADAAKASYGASPGDGTVDEPYFYVTPWVASDGATDPYWNATGFTGSVLPATALADHDDPLGVAVAFLRRGRDLLTTVEAGE